MISCVIGHRGVGKTSLANRLSAYDPDAFVFDLDKEIELSTGRSISDFFKGSGEDNFRRIEKDTFTLFYNKYKEREQRVYLILGAGFNFAIPQDCDCIWVRRETDSLGRSFFNRPRLSTDESPLEEYRAKFAVREPWYQSFAKRIYTLPEGVNAVDPVEREILTGTYKMNFAEITLLDWHFHSEDILKRLKNSSFRRIEIRDDLLSREQILRALEFFDKSNLLLSFRNLAHIQESMSLVESVSSVDWALELGLVPENLKASILSLHERKESIEKSIEFIESCSNNKDCILKLAIEIHSLEELYAGHQWHLSNPKRNCFLPRSKNGQWAWYRLLLKTSNPINFVREGSGTSLDQPSLYQYLKHDSSFSSFAAILGSPVFHSLSPSEHAEFFSKKSCNFLVIEIGLSDFHRRSLNILAQMGLRFAAVTSPLKERAFELCDQWTERAAELKSVNTICFNEPHWLGHNTDYDGLSALKEFVLEKQLGVIWGGGGTLLALKKVFPDFIAFSAREAKPREEQALSGLPTQLIWAAGEQTVNVPNEWPLKLIIDLSYMESSKGLEFAVERKIDYISGIHMFKEQALKQREFWDECK